ncbi:Sugar phosphatase YidA [compost metagenome]
MKYKLLALDMDGTLLNDNHEISPMTVEWITKAVEAGVHVCLSTGRGFSEAIAYAEQLGLNTPMITVNGSEVWKAPHELYHREMLDKELVRHMIALAKKTSTWFWAYAVEGAYNERNWNDDLIETQQWMKFGYHTEDNDIRHQLIVDLQNLGGLEITNSSPYNLEINPKGINKASGINVVCKDLLGIEMSEVVAVGDSLNDLAAITAAGLGVAMGNAQETVKEQADVVTASNNDDGIALIIRDYILNNKD